MHHRWLYMAIPTMSWDRAAEEARADGILTIGSEYLLLESQADAKNLSQNCPFKCHVIGLQVPETDLVTWFFQRRCWMSDIRHEPSNTRIAVISHTELKFPINRAQLC